MELYPWNGWVLKTSDEKVPWVRRQILMPKNGLAAIFLSSVNSRLNIRATPTTHLILVGLAQQGCMVPQLFGAARKGR